MRLIERIVSADETKILCLGRPHASADYPLRIEGDLFAAALVELGAQAAAAHASLHAIKGNHTGLLIGLQNIEIATPEIPNCAAAFEISARQLHLDSNGSLYEFEVKSAGTRHVSGRAALKMQGEPE